MISYRIQLVLILFYVGLSVINLLEKNYAKALYWFGALILTTGVLWMK